MATTPPITPEMTEQMKTRLEDLKEAEVLAARMERAGIDVTSQRQELKELRTRFGRIKAEFFPTL